VDVVVRERDLLGEGPAYDAVNARLLRVDYLRGWVRELRWAADAGWEVGLTWELGQLASAVVPNAGGGLLVVGGTTVVALADDGGRELFASLGDDVSAMCLNDAKCDPDGRLVVGWVVPDGRGRGGAVRVDGDGCVEPIVRDVGYANGLDWSPDGGTFYLVDTLARHVHAFDYDSAGGLLANPRTLLRIERGVGAPDGMAVDDEGCLWVAVPYAGEVRRYAPDGSLVETIETPTRMPTSCAFAGPDGRQLFITSQSRGLLSPGEANELEIAQDRIEAGHRDPLAGAVFVCRPGVSGPPARPFGA